nr:GTPase activator [Cryptococcus depauperatus CBS 7841]
MSPVPPPPAGTFVPSEDWTDDPSFDLSASNLKLPSSPSPSSSSSHRSSFSRSHTSSPLRQCFIGQSNLTDLKGKKQPAVELDALDDDFDLPAGDLTLTSSPHRKEEPRPRSSTASSTSSVTRTIVGQGPQGVGMITKLGGTPAARPGILAGTVKARAKALERNWEADVDLDDLSGAFEGKGTLRLKKPSNILGRLSEIDGGGRQLTVAPPKHNLPDANALDDLMDLEDEDQATLKAGATIKAMLPPPRTKLKSLPPPRQPVQSSAKTDDAELEADFALPLNLKNLILATQSAPRPYQKQPRNSNTSTMNTESWESPDASSAASKKWGWGSEDSPGKRMSETSATSVSDGPADRGSKKKRINEADEEEDLESGLVFEPTFFSAARAKKLNSILDRKRKPQYAPQLPATPDTRRKGDDSFEDGLVLDEPGVELSRHRLRAQKRARDRVPPLLRSDQPAKSVVKEREKAWEKHREQGWGRNTPVHGVRDRSGLVNNTLQSTPRDKNQSSLGLSLRSHSIATVSREGSRGEVALSGREKEAMRSRSGQLLNMPPPSIPLVPSQSPTPSTSRLRHQKSHYHLAAPPQSPSLTRKQSLASLQDAMADKNLAQRFDALSPPPLPTTRYHGSTSRLTMPTSSSRAKIRPPISSVFPKQNASGFSSSTTPAQSGSAQIRTKMYSTQMSARTVDVPKKPKNYGDGTELDGIDDLRVDEEVTNASTQRSMVGLGLGKPSCRGKMFFTCGEPKLTVVDHDPSHKLGLMPKGKLQDEKRKKSGPTQLATRKFRRKGAGLIKHLGGADKKKVVGEMTWNPATLRWEGNESVLCDFDTISSSRPALITHYTGSSVGAVSSPANSAASAAPRIVGDMQFDPVQMKWVSILAPEEDEPDPFEGMADDEDEETGGGTIRAGVIKRFVPIGSGTSVASSSTWSQRLASDSSMAASTASWEERTRPDVGIAISSELWAECKDAEDRHKKEMRGWVLRAPHWGSEMRDRERREEKRLWEIRHLALRS